MKKCKKKTYSYPRTPDGWECVDVPTDDVLAVARVSVPNGFEYAGRNKDWYTPDRKVRRLYFKPRK